MRNARRYTYFALECLLPVGLPLEPPHAHRGDVEEEWDKSSEEDDPSSGKAESFTIVQREQPGKEGFSAGEPVPIVNAKHLTAILVQPYLALAARLSDFARLV